MTISEPISTVQRQLAHVIAAIASKHPWPELLNSLPEMSQSINLQMKQLCCFLIDKLAGYFFSIFYFLFLLILVSLLLEFIGPFLLENIEIVWEILSSVLNNNNNNNNTTNISQLELLTKVSAGNAMISLLQEIADPNLYFQQVILNFLHFNMYN